MQAIVVTGGAGFIGANLVRLALRETDARVVVVDKLTYAGNRRSLADVEQHPRFVFVQADIGDRPAMEALLREHRPDAVLNLAAETHVDRSIDGPRGFVDTNVVGTLELLEAARRYVAGLEPGQAAPYVFKRRQDFCVDRAAQRRLEQDLPHQRGEHRNHIRCLDPALGLLHHRNNDGSSTIAAT